MATVRLEWVNGIERSTVVPCLIVTHLIRTPCYFGWLSLSLGKALTFSLLKKLNLGEQGWRSGESTRLPPVWPGFESWCRRHMWVEFVVGSLLCSERFFSRYSRTGFPLSLKTSTFKFQFDLERTDTFQRVLMNSLVICG